MATAASPAELRPARCITSDPGAPASITLRVVGYVPPRGGTVVAVVRLRNISTHVAREIGRFGIFPDASFTAATADAAQRFGFPLSDSDLAFSKDPHEFRLRRTR